MLISSPALPSLQPLPHPAICAVNATRVLQLPLPLLLLQFAAHVEIVEILENCGKREGCAKLKYSRERRAAERRMGCVSFSCFHQKRHTHTYTQSRAHFPAFIFSNLNVSELERNVNFHLGPGLTSDCARRGNGEEERVRRGRGGVCTQTNVNVHFHAIVLVFCVFLPLFNVA